MLDKLITAITRDRQLVGLDISLQSDAKLFVRGIILELSKGKVLVKDKWALEGLDELPGKLSKGLPVALVLSGKGILHKQANPESPEQSINNLMLGALLPAIKPMEFYVQRYQAGCSAFFSLARRDKVDAICNQIKVQGANLIAISFGPFVFGNLWPYLQDERVAEKEIAVGDYILQIDAESITQFRIPAFEASRQEIRMRRVGEDDLEDTYLLAYGAAFQELVNSSNFLYMEASPVEANRVEYHHRKVFRLGLGITLAFFLIVLLSNFLLFASFSRKNSILEQKLAHKQNSLSRLNQLKKDVEEKRQFLLTTGWLHSSRWSFYADRIAVTIPKSVRLVNLAINPLDENLSKAQGHIVIENGLILIRGVCHNPIVLNEWMKKLAKLDWVDRIEKQNYTYDESKGEGKFEFYIRLKGNY